MYVFVCPFICLSLVILCSGILYLLFFVLIWATSLDEHIFGFSDSLSLCFILFGYSIYVVLRSK